MSEQANQAKSDFLSRMSHEVRTPLNTILGFAQLLEMNGLSAERQENVQPIREAGRHLLALINDVLDVARIEAGGLSLSLEPVHAGHAREDAMDLIRPLAAPCRVRVQADPRTHCDRYVLADRQRFKQILLNLLSNAVKYNRDGGEVGLSCEETTGGRLRMSVSDTGAGIPPHKMDRLVTPFSRLGADRSNVEGTGIGLALSKRLADLMAGTIGVASTPGQGSTFSLELPLVNGPALSDATLREHQDAAAFGECRGAADRALRRGQSVDP